MATIDGARQEAAANNVNPSDNLFLFSDLKESPRTTALEPRDLDALRAVATWTENFIIKPNQDLGRSGPVCPYTPVALEHDALWLALEHTDGFSISDAIERVKGYNRLLLAHQPNHGDIAGFKAILVVFADLAAAQAPRFFEELLKPIGLRFYQEDGLVIGPFYEGNEGTAIYNANFRPFNAPIPALLMRRAVVSDWKFFLNNPDWFDVWVRTHGEEGTKVLAAELRRFPWNAGSQS